MQTHLGGSQLEFGACIGSCRQLSPIGKFVEAPVRRAGLYIRTKGKLSTVEDKSVCRPVATETGASVPVWSSSGRWTSTFGGQCRKT